MRFDHVNIRTANLEAMRQWYVEVLGLRDGWRPPFDFPGAWLYLGEQAIVHLVGVSQADPGPGPIEHFALSADDLDAFRARLAACGAEADARPVPGTALIQLHLSDPDGNHIHVDFDGGAK